LRNDFAPIVREAMETSADSFVELIQQARQVLEMENGRLGNFQVFGRHVEINPKCQALIVSDIHGDLESLVHILSHSNIVHRMKEDESKCLIFLGDYGDRGEFSAEVYYVILKLKLLYPKQIVLMRGNHEGPMDLLASPHDLPMQFEERFGKKWHEVYDETTKLFPHLYISASVEKRYLMIHGGLPQQARKLEDFACANETHPRTSFLEEVLWSDPSEGVKGVYPSPRGAGRYFGKDVTRRVLDSLDVSIMIRGHEPCNEGFQINHDGRILTLFSRKGEPYCNLHGAYLDIELSDKYTTAEQLIPFICKFL
jgi:protein phosphatase